MSESLAGDLARLILRLSGFYLAFGHGLGKVTKLATGDGQGLIDTIGALGFPAPAIFAWAAALAELLGGLAIGLGIGIKIACGFAGFSMAVAAIGQHRAIHQGFAALGLISPNERTMEQWGSPEKALLYVLIFGAILLLGPGRFSIGNRLGKKKG